MNQPPDAVQIPSDFQRLEDMLRKDTWSVHEGLSEIVRAHSSTLSRGDVLAGMQLHARLQQIWESGDHPGERLPPSYFVAWAAQKRYALSWEPWARKSGWLDERATVTSLQQTKARKEARQGLAAARGVLEAAPDQADAMPYMTEILRVVAKVMRDNWVGYDPLRLPKQVNIAREIDRALGTTPEGGKPPTRMATDLAAAIQPDEVKATDKRRNLRAC